MDGCVCKNGKRSVKHTCECHAPQNATTQTAAPSQQSAAQQLATGNNLKDTKRNGAVTGDPGRKSRNQNQKPAHVWVASAVLSTQRHQLKSTQGADVPPTVGPQKTQKTQKRVKGGRVQPTTASPRRRKETKPRRQSTQFIYGKIKWNKMTMMSNKSHRLCYLANAGSKGSRGSQGLRVAACCVQKLISGNTWN